MENTITVIRQNDTGSQRHGGWRVYRHFNVYINGVHVETFSDDSSKHDYSSGLYLDAKLNAYVELMERALACHAIHGKVKDFIDGSGSEHAMRLKRISK